MTDPMQRLHLSGAAATFLAFSAASRPTSPSPSNCRMALSAPSKWSHMPTYRARSNCRRPSPKRSRRSWSANRSTRSTLASWPARAAPRSALTTLLLRSSNRQPVECRHPASGGTQWCSACDDLGLTYAKMIDTLPEGTYAGDFSAEAIQDFNMDYVLTTYRPHTGGTPENIYEEMAMVVPGYDSFMTSVINKHIISMRAEYVVPHTLALMHNVLDAFEANAAAD